MKNLLVLICLLLLVSPVFGQGILNGDLETYQPYFWQTYGDANADLTWTTDDFHGGRRSLEIAKTGTSGEAGWQSDNHAQTYWNHMEAATYNLAAWIKTEGVNTNPADYSEQFYIEWEFLAGGSQIVDNIYMDLPQGTADTDWTQLTGLVILPETPEEVYCYFRAGSNATGTVWADDFRLGSDPWTAGFFGGNMETPAGWMEWHATDGDTDLGTAQYSDEDSHSGNYSAKLADFDDGDDEIVFYSIPTSVQPNTYYHISTWVKWTGVNTDERFRPTNVVAGEGGRDNDRIGICFFYHRTPIDVAWDLSGGDQYFYLDQRETDGDWRKFEVISMSPEDAAGVSMRARFTSFPTGTVFFDDFRIEEIDIDDTNILENADLEDYSPFFWNEYEPGNAALTWATDDAHGGMRSLKVDKTATGGESGWNSHNHAQTYWNHMEAATYNFSAWVKTEGVNTNPGIDEERIWLEYEFLAGGVPIVDNVFVYVPQDNASMDWTQVSGLVVLPQAPDETYCFVRMGHDATGTLWADDFNLGSDPWTAGFFGGNMETPTGWMEWHATDGETDLATSQYSDEEAHSGTYSAKLADFDDGDDEIVFYTVPYPVSPEGVYAISGWVNWADVNTDEKYMPSNVISGEGGRDNNRIGFCFFYHRSPIDVAWDLSGGDQYFYIDQREADGEWTQFMIMSWAPEDAAGVSIRARFTSFPTGTVYFDDFAIQEVSGSNLAIENWEDPFVTKTVLPSILRQNYPNPFSMTGTTTIEYFIDQPAPVQLSIYNVSGQRVVTLDRGMRSQGWHSADWNGITDKGKKVPSGVYFYRLKTDENNAQRRMVILR